jgi:hypothetical protein
VGAERRATLLCTERSDTSQIGSTARGGSVTGGTRTLNRLVDRLRPEVDGLRIRAMDANGVAMSTVADVFYLPQSIVSDGRGRDRGMDRQSKRAPMRYSTPSG